MTRPATALLGDRSLFPHLEAIAYCNHAAISPPSLLVERAVQSVLLDYGRQGLGAFFPWQAQRERLRESCARLIGAESNEIALVPSTTRGISDVALSLPWRAKDRVVLFEGEFPTNVTPWQCAARLFDLEIVWQRAEGFRTGAGLDQLEVVLRSGVRLVAISAVQFQTGLGMPLEAIGRLCRQHGAELFVDAIQALGVVPLDVRRCQVDYLSCGSHKWLMGVEGAGLLFVRSECATKLVPRVAGWLSHEQADTFLRLGPGHLRYDRPFKQSARVFEGSAQNVLGFAALQASLEVLLELGIARIFEHLQAYHDELEGGLCRRGFVSLRAANVALRSGTLSLKTPPGIDAIVFHQALGNAGIASALPDGVWRLSPHWPNSLAEVNAILERVDAALAAQRG